MDRAIKRTVTTTYNGLLSLTNRRLIMFAQKGGFDVQVSKITSIGPTGNGIVIQVGSKQHEVQTGPDNADIIIEAVRIVRRG